jgi:hypothetical protein
MARELNTHGVVDNSGDFSYNLTFTRVNGSLQQVEDGIGEGKVKQTGNGDNSYIYQSNVDASKYRQDLSKGDDPREVGPIFNGRNETSLGNVTDDTKMVYNGGSKSDGNGPKYNKYGKSEGYEKTEGDSILRKEKPYTLGDWNANVMRN